MNRQFWDVIILNMNIILIGCVQIYSGIIQMVGCSTRSSYMQVKILFLCTALFHKDYLS